MVHSWSVRFADYLGKELNLAEERIPIVAYGLEVIIGALIKLIVFTTIPLVLRVFPQFAAALISSAVLRLASGGVHCSAFYRCVICSLGVFLTIALISKYFSYTLPSDDIFGFSLVVAFTAFIILAPVDVEEKPIKSPTRRKILKFISCLLIIVYFFIFKSWDLSNEIVLASGLAILFHSFTLTKPGHSFFKWLDQII